MPSNVLVIDAESTFEIRLAAADLFLGAREAGATVRMRAIVDFFSSEWDHYVLAGLDHVVPPLLEPAALDDLGWADAIAFGVEGRDGNVPPPLKEFLESTVPLWRAGRLADKLVTVFGGGRRAPGDAGFALFQTACHWGSVFVTAAPDGEPVATGRAGSAARGIGRRLGELVRPRADLLAACTASPVQLGPSLRHR